MFRVTDTLTNEYFEVPTQGEVYRAVEYILSAGDLTEYEQLAYLDLIEELSTEGYAYSDTLRIRVEPLS